MTSGEIRVALLLFSWCALGWVLDHHSGWETMVVASTMVADSLDKSAGEFPTGPAPRAAAPVLNRSPADVIEPEAGRGVNINRADATALQTIPGIGPRLAKAILDYRHRHGPLARAEDLLAVDGIAARRLERIRPWVLVEPSIPNP